MMSKKLYVGNLPQDCEEGELRRIFEEIGRVVECDIIKQFAFVHMASEAEAKKAVSELHGTNFMGNNIKVQFSTTDVHRAPGIGTQGECFRCGSKGHLSRDCPDRTEEDRRGLDRGRGQGRGGGRGRGGDHGRGRGRGRGMGGRDYGGGYDSRPREREDWGRREISPRGMRSERDSYLRERDPYPRSRDSYASLRSRLMLPRMDPEMERRYEEAYRRLSLARECGLPLRARSRSPVRQSSLEYRRALLERSYADRYSRLPARDYYDDPFRSRALGPPRSGPSRY